MGAPRFFVDEETIDQSSGRVLLENAEQVKQLTTVLRLREGSRVDLLDNQGSLFRCEIENIQTGRRTVNAVSCRIIERTMLPADCHCHLTVAIPILRSGRFDWAVEKLTELGASTIVPLYAHRTVVQDGGNGSATKDGGSNAKLERWKSIAKEAAEQSERALIPNMVSPIKLSEFVGSSTDTISATRPLKLIAAERSQSLELKDVLTSELAKREGSGEETACERGAKSSAVIMLLGPEGGFTDEEFGLSFAHGFQPVTLGSRILRVETAAVYSASLVMAVLDNHK